MKTNSVNSNQNFTARIKINKDVKVDLTNSAVLSSMGTSSTGSGILSSLPAFEPAHHIHPMAKSVDMSSSIGGLGLVSYGAYYVKKAAFILYKSLKNININD